MYTYTCTLRRNVKTDSSLMPVSVDLIHVDRLPLATMRDCGRPELSQKYTWWAKNLKQQLYRGSKATTKAELVGKKQIKMVTFQYSISHTLHIAYIASCITAYRTQHHCKIRSSSIKKIQRTRFCRYCMHMQKEASNSRRKHFSLKVFKSYLVCSQTKTKKD